MFNRFGAVSSQNSECKESEELISDKFKNPTMVSHLASFLNGLNAFDLFELAVFPFPLPMGMHSQFQNHLFDKRILIHLFSKLIVKIDRESSLSFNFKRNKDANCT